MGIGLARMPCIRRARPLLGTFVEIAVMETASHECDAAIEAAFEVVGKVHDLMSFHHPDSDVSRLNREASKRAVSVDTWTYQVIETALDIHRRSKGLFDISVAPVLQHLGLLPRHESNRPLSTPDMQACDSVELLSNCRIRFRDEWVKIDLGGIAKGFAVDCAVAILRAHGASSGVVNAGGDLAAFGLSPYAIHVRDPRDPLRLMCCVDVRDEAIASSAARFDPTVSPHGLEAAIVDPRDGATVGAIAGVTVRASSCMVADALTKVVMIAGESATATLDHYGASALLVLPNGDLRLSPDWQHAVSLAA